VCFISTGASSRDGPAGQGTSSQQQQQQQQQHYAFIIGKLTEFILRPVFQLI